MRPVKGRSPQDVSRMLRIGVLLQLGTLLAGAGIGFGLGVWLLP